MLKTKQVVGASNRAVVYVRVSTKEQVEEGNSLSSQKKVCEEYAKRNGYEVVRVFEELGESAKTDDRTELQKLLTYCADRKNLIGIVIVYKVDRFARKTFDHETLRLILRRVGVDLKSASENFDDSPSGRFMERTLASVAEFDNDVRAERCSGGMLDAVKAGRYVWMAPIGYSNVPVAGQATIAPNEMASLVREAFELISTGLYPTEDVWRMMTKRGLRQKRGKPICRAYFHNMIRNKLYTGWIEKFGERHKGLFEPIVSEELFNQVQRILRNKGRKMMDYERDNPEFPLRRFVVNPTNGKKLTGSFTKGRNGAKHPYYRFGMKDSNYKRDGFETTFKSYMDKHAIPVELIGKLKQFVRDEFGKATKDERRERERLESQLKELSDHQTQLLQKNLKGIISDEVLKQQLDLIEQKMSDIKVGLSRKDKEVDVSEALAFCEQYLTAPSSVWEIAGVSSKLRLQWFQFPKGTTFDGQTFGTAEISNVFKAKQAFLPVRSTLVDPSGFEPLTSSLQMRRSTN